MMNRLLFDRAELFQASEEELNRKEYRVHLTIHASGTDERSISNDIMRLQNAYNCIRHIPGRDHYDLLVVNGEWQVLLKPQDDTLHYTPEMHKKLEEELGTGSVAVEVVEQ